MTPGSRDETDIKEIARLRNALNAALGYLMNARIDLETGATKKTAINTIDGGIRVVRAALEGAACETH